MCLFSRHDLIKEPPFSRLQLITCRNLMIYFELSCSTACSAPSIMPCVQAVICSWDRQKGSRGNQTCSAQLTSEIEFL